MVLRILLVLFCIVASVPIIAQETVASNKYAAENEALAHLPQKKRVVFMGDSITELWKMLDSDFFIANDYINRGISGETTTEMLLRFQKDVIENHPEVVVILGGTNDIAQNKGFISTEKTFENIVSMAQMAKQHHIRVVLCSVLPVFDFKWHPGLEPAKKVIQLNAMIRSYANKHHMRYVNYFFTMADKRNGLKTSYTEDGVHPVLAGYKVMEPLVVKGITKAIRQK